MVEEKQYHQTCESNILRVIFIGISESNSIRLAGWDIESHYFQASEYAKPEWAGDPFA